MTTETERELRTSPEIGGMGHSVKRKEDPRFIRGAGRVHRGRQPAGPALARHRPESLRPRDDQVDRRHRGAEDPGCRRGRHRQGPGGLQAPLDADAGRRHADGAPGGHRDVPVAGGRGGHRHLPLCRRRRCRRRPRRLRAAAGHRRPAQGARARRVRPPARPRTGQGQQPHLALGIGRPGRRGCRARGRRGDRRSRTSTSRASTSPRSRRAAASPIGIPIRQQLDAAHDQPGAARHPDGARPRGRRRRPAHLRAEHPGQDARHRRWLRRQGAGLPGLRPGRRRLVPHRQAGQVDRGPEREPPGRLVRPRLPHPRRDGGDQGRQDHRPEGQDDRRPRLHATPRPTRRSSRPACSTSSPARTTSPTRSSRSTASTPTSRPAASPTAARSG